MSSQVTFNPLTVKAIHIETDQAKSFVFAPAVEHKSAFEYQPGQFLTFRIPLESGNIERSYSLSSTPGFDPEMTVCVKRVTSGKGSNWFHDQVQVGMRVWSKMPAGRFTLDKTDHDILLVAGGSGITPCISLIKQTLLQTKRNIKLIYVNTDKPNIIYADILQYLVEKFADRFTCIHWLDDENGLIGPENIVDLTRDCSNISSYICGPDQLMSMAEQTLADQPSVTKSIKIERFVSPEDDTKQPVLAKAENIRTEDFITQYGLKLDEESYQVTLDSGKTLLQAALDANLDVPHSCTEGHCGACMGKLVTGKVDMASTKALSKRNLEQGYILLCQSRPCSAEPLTVNMDI